MVFCASRLTLSLKQSENNQNQKTGKEGSLPVCFKKRFLTRRVTHGGQRHGLRYLTLS
jgi:hypothetical protein